MAVLSYLRAKDVPSSEQAVCVEIAQAYSDQDPRCLARLAELFIEAHHAAPGGLSIELGTRKGGSAVLFLQLLLRLYPAEKQPMLFTVDPYGLKPYDGGDCVVATGLYGDEEYLAAKSVLRGYPNHAHFLMESSLFLTRMWGLRFYRDGKLHLLKDASFIFHDADHSPRAILEDVDAVGFGASWIDSKGLLVVDNVHANPKTADVLQHHYRGVTIEKQYAVLRGSVVRDPRNVRA